MAQVVLAPIDTPERAGQKLNLPVIASTRLYPGTLLALSGGFATYAQDAAGLEVVGRAEQDVDNTADSVGGALSIDVKRGVFMYQNSSRSSAAYALAAANVGQLCYIEDEQTVQVVAGSAHKVIAGIFLGLDPDTGMAIVDTRGALRVPSADTLTALTFTTPTAAEVSALRTAVLNLLVTQGLVV
jgi:hypothetical protein